MCGFQEVLLEIMMPWKIILFSVAVSGIYFMNNNKDVNNYYPEWPKIIFNKLINNLKFNFNRKQTSDDNYYVMFVLQWPTSACIFEVIDKRKGQGNKMSPEQSCRFPPQQLSWTIHGIWNNRSSGNRCSSRSLDRSDIENITAELNERWITVKKFEENFKFWKYQWDKHGSCLSEHDDLNEPYKYFKQAVAWHRRFDPTAAFIACGMPPDDKKTYNNVEMTKCLKEQLNITSRIILSCKNDYTYRSGASVLREFGICLDKNLTLTDCQDSNPIFDFIYPRTVENQNELSDSFTTLSDLFCGFGQSVCNLFNNYLNHFVA